MATSYPAARSAIQACIKMFDVPLMAFLKNEASSSIRESALSFFLDVLLCCSWRRVELLLFRSATAETAESTFIGLQCNFCLFQGCLYKGLDVKLSF